MQTYNDVYISARKRLKAMGVEAYNLEARVLAAHCAGKTKEAFYRDANLYAGDAYERAVEDALQRREAGEPVAYIIGEWEFYGLPIQVSPDVLIPRVDTEVLAEAGIEFARKRGEGCRVLDLCAGSGCVGLAVAAKAPDCKAVLCDISPAALKHCRANTIKNGLTARVISMEADAKARPPMLLGQFDLIVCNPPYIPSGDLDGLDSSVKDYEPMLALDGGADGLVFYRLITRNWKNLLRPGGRLAYECGIGQAEDVERILEQEGFTQITTISDTGGIRRVVYGDTKTEEGAENG